MTTKASAEAPAGGSKPLSARARRRQELIDEIVDTAAPLFARKGYAETGVAELCETLGMARGHLYHLIGSKENLLKLIHQRFIDLLHDAAVEISRTDAPPAERLRLITRHLMRTIADHQDYVWVFFTEGRALSPDSREEYRRKRRAYQEIVESIIDEGQAAGQFVEGRPRLLALALLGMANESYQWLDPRGAQTPEQIADLFADVFLQGIITTGRRARAARTEG